MEKNPNMPVPLSIVYLAAGISSRFNGKVKQFEVVKKNGESLIEVSMTAAVSAGFNEIIFIVGDKTKALFKEKFKDNFLGVPVKYAQQSFDSNERDRPWGTTDALVSAKNLINNSFLICNGDDLYGANSFGLMRNFLLESTLESECASAGYELGKVIPNSGAVNRAVYSFDSRDYVIGLEERFNIEKTSLAKQGLNEGTLVSMNLFALKKSFLALLEEKLLNFKKSHSGDRRAECYLPVELGNLIKEGRIKMKLIRTDDEWLGITNPGDEVLVREALAAK